MKNIQVLFLIIALVITASFGMKKVNSRWVPEEIDFIQDGGGPRYKNIDSLLTEVANIFDGTRNSDKLNVSKVTADTLAIGKITATSTLTVNGITDTGNVNVVGRVIAKYSTPDTLVVGSGGSAFTKIWMDADSLKVIVGGTTYKFLKD
ncbi:MAG: hypothetical protein EHM12_11340 [Dehalococcoidia bacterium]|nr:MAG: hypothetical protein EHM12_11340 [Dehalococcoidia bacterium]